MSNIMNRKALKNLSSMNIDSQAFYQKAVSVFTYIGEPTPEYKEACVEIKNIFNDLEVVINLLRPAIEDLNKN